MVSTPGDPIPAGEQDPLHVIIGSFIFANEPIKEVAIYFFSVLQAGEGEETDFLRALIGQSNRERFLVDDGPTLSN